MPAHEDVAEHGQGDGEPHGHHVARDDPQVMEQDEVHPRLGVAVSLLTQRPGQGGTNKQSNFKHSTL